MKTSSNNRIDLRGNPQIEQSTLGICIKKILPVILFVAAGFAIYANTLNGPFILDDYPNIVENPHIRLEKFSIESIKYIFKNEPAPRPVAYFTFALNYFAGGYNTSGYHIFNLLIHLLCAGLLFYFIRLTLRINADIGKPDKNTIYPIAWVSFFTALIWLVHPANTQSVTYIVQRMNSMGAFFYLLAIVFYIHTRLAQKNRTTITNRNYSRTFMFLFLSLISGLLALGCKENTASLPVLILFYDWIFFKRGQLSFHKRQVIIIASTLLILLVIAAYFLGSDPISKIMALYDKQNFSPLQRIMTEWRVIIYYISLFIYPNPSRLAIEHDYPVSIALLHPVTTAHCLVTISSMIIMALYTFRKDRIISLCLFWFLITLAIESSFLGLAIIFEHRVYQPFMLLTFLLVVIIFRICKSKPNIAIAICFAIAISYSLWTYQRNNVWKTAISIYSDNYNKAPRNPRVLTNLGLSYAEKGNIKTAAFLYTKAIRIAPNLPLANNNMGKLCFDQGRYESAIHYYSNAIRNKEKADAGKIPLIYNNIGLSYMHLENYTKAIYYYKKALLSEKDMEPGRIASIKNDIGSCYLKLGDPHNALTYYKKAISIMPEYAIAYFNLGSAYLNTGNIDSALINFEKSARFDPANPVIHYNVGTILYRYGESKKAVKHLKTAIRLRPGYIAAELALQSILAHTAQELK